MRCGDEQVRCVVFSRMKHRTRFPTAGIARALAAALCVGAQACQSASIAGGDGITDAPGIPAQVVFVTTSVAGGQRLLDSLQIDSTSGRWSQAQCGPVSASNPACGDFRTDTGTMETFLRAPLFERAAKSDFKALRREYRRSGQLPPDVATHLLHIVQNGRRHIVTWESGAELPPALEAFLCRLQQSRGALILCRE